MATLLIRCPNQKPMKLEQSDDKVLSHLKYMFERGDKKHECSYAILPPESVLSGARSRKPCRRGKR